VESTTVPIACGWSGMQLSVKLQHLLEGYRPKVCPRAALDKELPGFARGRAALRAGIANIDW
jgi:hypothetical protein